MNTIKLDFVDGNPTLLEVNGVKYTKTELKNSATISGKHYPIPDGKIEAVKKVLEPGLPYWAELPHLDVGYMPYRLKNAAAHVNEGWKPDWNDVMQDKFYLTYFNGEFGINYMNTVSPGVPTFKSREAAMKAVEIFRHNGDYDELVKYYQQ